MSVSKVTEAKKTVKFYYNDCQILDQDDKVVAVGVRRGNIYYLSCQQVKDDQVHVMDVRLNAESKEFMWHRRFGDLNESLHTIEGQRLIHDFDYNTSKQMPFVSPVWRVNYTKLIFQVEVKNGLKYLLVWFIATCVDHWVVNR